MNVLVMAKEPVPGRVKTRLCPPCTPTEAAELAAAALADTLDSAVGSGAERVVLALDGRPGDWCPPGIDVVAQCDGPFGDRLAAAWAAVSGPTVQIGMDTPQVTSQLLDDAMWAVQSGGEGDALVGPALDGGWWLLGMRRACDGMFDGVPMSAATTGAAQVARLRALGRTARLTTTLRDLDTIDDLAHVAAAAPPGGRFRSTVRRLGLLVADASLAEEFRAT